MKYLVGTVWSIERAGTANFNRVYKTKQNNTTEAVEHNRGGEGVDTQSGDISTVERANTESSTEVYKTKQNKTTEAVKQNRGGGSGGADTVTGVKCNTKGPEQTPQQPSRTSLQDRTGWAMSGGWQHILHFSAVLCRDRRRPMLGISCVRCPWKKTYVCLFEHTTLQISGWLRLLFFFHPFKIRAPIWETTFCLQIALGYVLPLSAVLKEYTSTSIPLDFRPRIPSYW